MKTAPMKWFDMDTPVFAFSHCRDVVAAVTRNGGIGAIGTTHVTPDQLDLELNWIDDHTNGRPYAVDVMFASKPPEGSEGLKTPEDVEGKIPEGHKKWVEELLEEFDVPKNTPEESHASLEHYLQNMARTHEEAKKRVEVIFKHPNVKMIVSALGPPPPDVMEECRKRGIKVAAMCGSPRHVKYHKQAGVDLIIACGYEAAGHTGEIGGFVLTPQIVREADGIPVLHGGGVSTGGQMAAALALGAAGVWTGTIWLTTPESEATPLTKKMIFEGGSLDTKRSKCGTGKYARRLVSRWITAWDEPDAPDTLPMPYQSILINEALERMEKYQPEGLWSYPSGQGIALLDHERDVKTIMYELLVEFGETCERLGSFLEEG